MLSKVLIIDDDIQICELLTDALEEYGYIAHAVQNGQDALNLLRNSPDFSLIFLDLILPDINGLVLLQELKNITSAPIIMLSGLSSESDIVVGLEIGADDYITKPFYPREVIARAKAAIRRSQPTQNHSHQHHGFSFNQWFLDTDNHKLISPQKQNIALTGGEYALLYTLCSHAQRVLSRQQLLELTHSENLDIFDRTIDVLIMRLRKKIEPNARVPCFIQTVRGTGYLFACDVTSSQE
ncbi:response regulator transcription factor [Lonepinella sp. BR2474]|uniref:response regulator transcription factor n=1 Tax=Lonepinella sp. BR2474 TaxID=3434548 RepID=UPI003F6DB9E9